ncbi:MAG: glycosyltransferase family 4 protein [Pseudomonadota bacterium]|nr:glycosyltransferase family 4 protein [Pseudomonadota bacterium]
MRIGIDACTWSNRRGYGRFTRQIVSALVRRHPAHRFVLVVDGHTARECRFPSGADVRVVETVEQPTKAAGADGSRRFADLLRMSWAASRARFDAFYFPADYSFFPLLGRTPTAVTVHDATSQSHPELLFSNLRARLFWQVKMRLAVRRADRLVTVSNDARRQIAAAFGRAEASITVVSEGPDPLFRPLAGDPAGEAIRARYRLPARAPLILYVGGISPHKNLQGLLRAAALMQRQDTAPWHVVLVGDYLGDSFLGCYGELVALVRELQIGERVTFTGFVPDEDLLLLYNAATMLVLPSLGEGFGLPVVEAMACGLPVAASDRNSLPEVLGGAGLLFEPESDDAIAASMQRVLHEPGLAEALRDRGLQRAQAYSWDSGADSLMQVFEDLTKRAGVRL